MDPWVRVAIFVALIVFFFWLLRPRNPVTRRFTRCRMRAMAGRGIDFDDFEAVVKAMVPGADVDFTSGGSVVVKTGLYEHEYRKRDGEWTTDLRPGDPDTGGVP